MNNETIGMSVEKALCDLFDVPNSISENRINDDIIIKIYDSNVTDILLDANISIEKHIGGNNGPIDFLCNINKKLSLKTLKKKRGKICPQGGQPTYNSFHKHNPECPKPNKELSRSEANIIRWNWIKSNIGNYLNKMLKNTFCCDYLLIITNCQDNPEAELLKKNILI